MREDWCTKVIHLPPDMCIYRTVETVPQKNYYRRLPIVEKYWPTGATFSESSTPTGPQLPIGRCVDYSHTHCTSQGANAAATFLAVSGGVRTYSYDSRKPKPVILVNVKMCVDQ